MPTTINERRPPTALVRAINPLARALALSPLHGLVDPAVLLLHVTGRKTGRRYVIPVGYTDLDGRFLVFTAFRWRANLRGGADVEVTWHGRRRPMHALLDEEPAAVAVAYQSIIDRIGWRVAASRLGISTPDGHEPTAVELRDAARDYHWSVITLSPQ